MLYHPLSVISARFLTNELLWTQAVIPGFGLSLRLVPGGVLPLPHLSLFPRLLSREDGFVSAIRPLNYVPGGAHAKALAPLTILV